MQIAKQARVFVAKLDWLVIDLGRCAGTSGEFAVVQTFNERRDFFVAKFAVCSHGFSLQDESCYIYVFHAAEAHALIQQLVDRIFNENLQLLSVLYADDVSFCLFCKQG